MKTFLKWAGGLLLIVMLVALAAYAWAMSTATRLYEKHWEIHDATFPIPWALTAADLDSLKQERIAAGASKKDPLAGVDLEAVALERAASRGGHLIDSRLGCKGCHGADMGGGVVIDVPMVGYWAAPNLTSGEGSVTRGFSAHDWDSAVRHGVRHDGRTSSMPCEEFRNLSDHELSDVAAYIRSVPPVKRDPGHVRLGPVFAFMLATDPKTAAAIGIDHQAAHAAEPPLAEPTAAFGEHLVQVCRGCHGANLSGGKLQGDPSMPIVANLTPHASGLATWKEADFVHAMRTGKRPDGSTISEMMPWKAFGTMSDDELVAIWAYLRTQPPTPKGTH
jgi:mono/diheme cytochrome c family protein